MTRNVLWLGVLLCMTTTGSALAGEPEVGELYPELRLPTIDGSQTISIRGLRGKKVLLIEFASW